ncbi:shikimate 5-dehydrogenase [Klebsiella pneumoniae]|uniref:Shikimate 5-dehydrogenase n=1 Tax=Klebsiella pneumoniae TaxID=573 RepID=A0A2X1SH73_KLEPN|nr:shikimate 5-dehydrogenase [Klebsiella pneumoniae]
MVISGNTRLIAHLGYPTASFKAPMIYNPRFVDQQVDVKVVPMGVRPEDYAAFIPPLFTMTNIIGALVTMPHKIATCDLVQRLSPTAAIAGACNAIRREADGSLSGDMSDGEGFVLGLRRKGFNPQGTRALVVGSGGVGSAIAASLAAAGGQRPDPVRYPTRGGARPRRAAASALSAARYHPDAARSCRTRAGGQCHPRWG